MYKRTLLMMLLLSLLPLTVASGSTPHKRTSHRCSTCGRDKHGRIKRSSRVKAAFERAHPCPSTHKMSGACPGYVVDHKIPLRCGGADAPSNLQWQPVAEAKAKDKIESRCR